MPHVQHPTKADDEFDRLFPACTLTYLLTVVTHDQLGTAIEVLSAVRDLGGGLDALHVTRVGDKAEHRLNVTGLRPQQARLLASRVAEMAEVERAGVEHRLLRLDRASASNAVPTPACSAREAT